MTPEEQFHSQNGMTLEQAWEKIQAWETEGKHAEAISGCREIVKIFPDHIAKDLLQKLTVPPSLVEEELPEEKEQPPSLGEKLKGVVNFVITGEKPAVLLKKQKKSSPDEPQKEGSPASSSQKKSSGGAVLLGGISTSAPREIDATLPEENSIDDNERMFAALSYIPFLCFFTLSSRKDSRFVQYHAWQGLALLAIFLVSLPVYFLLGVLSLFAVLFWFLYLFFFAIVFFALWTAWSGKYLEIPFISSLARSLSGKRG